MSETDIDANIDQIRELCRGTLRSMRASAECHKYQASLDAAVLRRRRCIEVFDGWYRSLSKRAQRAFRMATDLQWDGDSLSRLTRWQVVSQANCGEKTLAEICNTLRDLGIELPESSQGAVMVFISTNEREPVVPVIEEGASR